MISRDASRSLPKDRGKHVAGTAPRSPTPFSASDSLRCGRYRARSDCSRCSYTKVRGLWPLRMPRPVRWQGAVEAAMWYIVARLRRSPAGGAGHPAGGVLAALGQRRALGM